MSGNNTDKLQFTISPVDDNSFRIEKSQDKENVQIIKLVKKDKDKQILKQCTTINKQIDRNNERLEINSNMISLVDQTNNLLLNEKLKTSNRSNLSKVSEEDTNKVLKLKKAKLKDLIDNSKELLTEVLKQNEKNRIDNINIHDADYELNKKIEMANQIAKKIQVKEVRASNEIKQQSVLTLNPNIVNFNSNINLNNGTNIEKQKLNVKEESFIQKEIPYKQKIKLSLKKKIDFSNVIKEINQRAISNVQLEMQNIEKNREIISSTIQNHLQNNNNKQQKEKVHYKNKHSLNFLKDEEEVKILKQLTEIQKNLDVKLDKVKTILKQSDENENNSNIKNQSHINEYSTQIGKNIKPTNQRKVSLTPQNKMLKQKSWSISKNENNDLACLNLNLNLSE